MYVKFMSDCTVGHKGIYLAFPSFMSFLWKKLLRILFTHVGIYTPSLTVSESRFVSSGTVTLIDYRLFAL